MKDKAIIKFPGSRQPIEGAVALTDPTRVGGFQLLINGYWLVACMPTVSKEHWVVELYAAGTIPTIGHPYPKRTDIDNFAYDSDHNQVDFYLCEQKVFTTRSACFDVFQANLVHYCNKNPWFSLDELGDPCVFIE